MATINGTYGNDLLVGSAAGDTLLGNAGNDTLDGSAGFTFAAYYSSTSAVGVELFDGNVINDGLGGHDRLINVHGVIGSAFNDIILGSGLSDVLIGIDGNDTLQGLDGDDLLNGAIGDDNIDGGNGTDTAYFSGNRSDYIVTAVSGGFTVADTRSGSSTDGTDVVVNVELFRFADGTLAATDLLMPGAGSMGGNDTLTAGAGDGVLDGGAGTDTVVFSQVLGAYTVQDLGQRVLVSGPDGNDTLLGVERLQFKDGTVNRDDGDLLFDTLGYYRNNLDVFQAGVGAKAHYEASGWHEGRDPNTFFNTNAYLAANQDVRAAGINPLSHYDQSGWREGRDPSAKFDTELYLKFNADVAAAGVNPLTHWLSFGEAEGRKFAPVVGSSITSGFDATYYKLANPDVANAGVDPLTHFNANGWHEGRNPNAFFDTNAYLAANQDVKAAGINPLSHYD